MHSYCKQTLSQKLNICICKGAVLVDSYTSTYLKSLQMYLCNQCLSPLTLSVRIPLWQGVLDSTLYDNVCQWHVTYCN
jgi:hypothetical protein